MLSDDDIPRFDIRRIRRLTLKERLVAQAKNTYPFPPNPFCASWVSVNLVDEALQEAGYTNYTLFIRADGIYIEPKQER